MAYTLDPSAGQMVIDGHRITVDRWSRSPTDATWAYEVSPISGKVHRVKRRVAVELTVTMFQSNPDREFLSALAASDQNGIPRVVPVLLRDAISGRTIVASESAFLVGYPDSDETSGDVGENDWVFVLENPVNNYIGGIVNG